ncbi:hypothetical protein [Streptomyces brasiliensis]|uniref:hypothetical protein n=1 Tax=Streptomyces brasiliensis TaxID=1954 RepID=UPI001670F255
MLVVRHLDRGALDHRAGAEEGVFTTPDPAATARAVFHATGRFHDPAYAREWRQPQIETELEAVLDLLLRRLRAGWCCDRKGSPARDARHGTSRRCRVTRVHPVRG